MLRMRATRERAELVVEPRVVPEEDVLLLLRCLLTVGRRRGVEEKVGEDKPTPAVPMDCGEDVARRGVIPSCCGGEGAGDGVNKPTPAAPMEGGVASLAMILRKLRGVDVGVDDNSGPVGGVPLYSATLLGGGCGGIDASPTPAEAMFLK